MGTIFSSEVKPAAPLLQEHRTEAQSNILPNRSVKKYKKKVNPPQAFDIFERRAEPLHPIQEHEQENYPESPKEMSVKIYDNHALQQMGYVSGMEFYDLKKIEKDIVYITDDIIMRKTHKKTSNN
jgi:hypothetical protein